MSDQSTSEQRHLPSSLPDAEAAELLAIVGRARKGDHSAVPRLRQILAARPQIWQHYGDLGLQVRMAWIALAAGNDLHALECLRSRAAAMQRELVGGSTSQIVQLMAERVVLAWLQAFYFDGIEVKALRKPEPLPLLNYRAKRGTQAGRQYLMALAAFATLKKLLPNDVPTAVRSIEVRPAPQRLIEVPPPPAAPTPPAPQVAPAPVVGTSPPVEEPEPLPPRQQVKRITTTAGEPTMPVAPEDSEHPTGPYASATTPAPMCQANSLPTPKARPKRKRPASRKKRSQPLQPAASTP